MLRGILFILFFLFSPLAADASPLIRVGIVNGQRAAEIVAVGEQKVSSVASGAVLATFTPGSRHFIVAEGGKLKIDGQFVDSPRLRVENSAEVKDGNINNRSYRGVFQINILPGGNSLNVVNILPVEEYVYSTAGEELPPLWPVEAAKAQAVAARTLAMYAIRHSVANDFDVPAIYWQNYLGMASERDYAQKAVDDTAGEIVLWQGEPAKTLFFLSSGGHTEAGGQPYLVSVPDHDQDFPGYEWELVLTAGDVDSMLKYAGYTSIGKLQGFEFSPLDRAKPGQFPDRGASGRLKEVKILGDRGYAVIEGKKFAKILELPSSAFDLVVANLLPQMIEVPITDQFGNVIGVKQIPVDIKSIPKPAMPTERPGVQRVSWAENEKIIIKGHGAGDGIGLSQWGARALALAAADADGYYKNILGYYFPGTVVREVH